MDNQDMKYCKI